MTDCKHPRLKLLGGPIHPGGTDYHCDVCGTQFQVSEAVIGVRFGVAAPSQSTPEQEWTHCGHGILRGQPCQMCDQVMQKTAPSQSTDGASKSSLLAQSSHKAKVETADTGSSDLIGGILIEWYQTHTPAPNVEQVGEMARFIAEELNRAAPSQSKEEK